MKRLQFALIIPVLLCAFSCKKKDNGPSIDDYFLNYEIPEIPVTQDYVVGAFYNSFGTFNANIKEVPVVGKYAMPNGVLTAGVMPKHIEYAGKAGLDYFIFSYRSPNKDANNFKSDSTLIKGFVDANTASSMKFALVYNFSTGSYSVSTTSPLEADAAKLELFYKDFERVVPFLKNANYMKVDGKPVLYIANAQVMYSNDNKAIYATLRNRMNALGVQLYIVGMQDKWTPPARYPFRFQGCVDAIYHQCFSYQQNDWDRSYILPQAMDQNWEYSRKWYADNIGVDYVPNIGPAYSWKINNPASTNPEYTRADSGALYKKLCNVAKMNVSNKTRLILIDSWNKWDEDTQLEPAQSYGELYLNITRKEFKKQ